MTNYFDALRALMESSEEQEQAVNDAASAEQYRRETQVTTILKTAIQKLGLSLHENPHAVNYSEDMDRNAVILIHDHISLTQLQSLAVWADYITVGASASYPDVTEICITVKANILG